MEDGVLTAEVVSSCVSHIGRSGTGLQHLYKHLSLPNLNLRNISVLCNYVHLQKLELPHNKIKDLSCVSHMPYLTILDASHNEISDFFGFQPPKCLKLVFPKPICSHMEYAYKEVNFSHNHLKKMKDLSAYTSLMKLDLDHNRFTEIKGLEKCSKLSRLSLAHNRITRISSLGSLPLTDLCLRGNQLGSTEGLENLKNLRVLDLSLNRITSLSGLQDLHLLSSINLEKNLIREIQECKHIHKLYLLRELNLLGNPVQEQPDCRLSVIFLLQHLTLLDQEKVIVEQKVSSGNQFDPPMDVMAARDHMTQLVYQMMQPQVLYDSTLPSVHAPYPMLVLTGPQGCGKRELSHRLCQEFHEYFAYGTSHTTRTPYFGEENGSDYHFVSEEDFQNIIHMGGFIQTMEYGGHMYGLSRDAIEEVAREGLACCVHMELEGVLSLKKSYFEPRYILLIPTQAEKYIGHLNSRGLYTPAQINMALSRVDLYTNFNRQRPGFFDNVIACDDWEEAYQTLEQVVKDYLLLDGQEEGGKDKRASPYSTSTAPGPQLKPPTDLSGPVSAATLQSTAALDPSHPSYRHYSTKIRAQLSSAGSPAELASIRRREQLVREAIVGKSPRVYSQLIKSSAQPEPLSLQFPNELSEHSSSDQSRVSSAQTLPSSAGALSVLTEPPGLSIPEHTVETTKDATDEQAAVVTPPSDRRPGCSSKPILPPIPTGRRTPAAPSPVSSPSPNRE